MTKAEIADNLFKTRNCAQSVLAAFAEDYGLEKEKALQAAVGFGAGMGRLQETCGAVTGAIIVLGLSSGFKESDGREKINDVYAKVRGLVNDFSARKGTVKCRELLGCDLLTDEGQKYFKEHSLSKDCQGYVRLVCELLEKYLN